MSNPDQYNELLEYLEHRYNMARQELFLAERALEQGRNAVFNARSRKERLDIIATAKAKS